jgi:CelD/BcsL family acetyltransferase involved in cellulose biosynthesis
VNAASSHAAKLAAGLEELGWRQLRETSDVCPYVDLGGRSWETYLDSLGSAHRYNFRRRLRNLYKRHDVSFVQARDEAQRRDMLRTLITLHQKRWNGLSQPGAFDTPDLVCFHDEWSRLALQRGWLRLYLLSLDGLPAASLYGLRSGDVFYFYQSGFDPAYAKSSVGMIVLGLAIKSAVEEGVHEYDLLHGDESYKFKWATGTRPLARFTLYPPTGRGMLNHHTAIARQGMKRVMSGLWNRAASR